jgi:hypothetical protein
MLSREENELLTRVGPDTPIGQLMRHYWMPAQLSEELPEPDCAPVRVRLLGEDLVAFRDSAGKSVCSRSIACIAARRYFTDAMRDAALPRLRPAGFELHHR